MFLWICNVTYLYLHIWLLDELQERGYWLRMSFSAQNGKAPGMVRLLVVVTSGPPGREAPLLSLVVSHYLPVGQTLLPVNWWVMTWNLTNLLWFLARQPLLSEKGVWNLKQTRVDFQYWRHYRSLPGLVFVAHFVCQSVSIPPGRGSTISACTEGNLVGPGQGRTMLRACPVRAANPSLKPGNALKMRCWQALLKKYRI